MSVAGLIAVASGRAQADLLLANAQVVNTFSGRLETGNVAIAGGLIAGVGDYRSAKQVIDLEGRYLAPGLIDGHVHIESSMLHPVEYARAVVPRGVLSVVTDLHEIANVGGLAGVRSMMKWCQGLPCDFFFMLPSCVPASPLETSGATLTSGDLKKARRWRNVVGLGEMMNFPGVVKADVEVLGKIHLFQKGVVDGHAPGLGGRELNAYVAAGPRSDHESTSLGEAKEKLARGMYVMIRQGSSEKNLDELLPLVDERTCRRCLFVVDDRSCVDLLADGEVDAVVRRAVSRGLDPIRAIQMATLNAAEHFRLRGLGAVAPGYVANLIATSDLDSMKAEMVFHRGRMVARNGEMLIELPKLRTAGLDNTVRIRPFSRDALALRTKKDTFPVIEVIPGQIVTRKIVERVHAKDSVVSPDVARDLLKLVVIERHRGTGNIGVGLVKGFGLKGGALASSVAHDSHNVIAVGCGDDDIVAAVNEVQRLQGGLVVCEKGAVVASMPLPIAGLLSDKPLLVAAEEFRNVERAVAKLGTKLSAPFAALSFLALAVIPELKLTDLGLVDVTRFRLLSPQELE